MAPRVRTRTAQRPSYVEESSDDEQDQSAEESFVEEDDDDDVVPTRRKRKHSPRPDASQQSTARTQPAARTRRQPRKTYAEDFSDPEASDFDTDEGMDVDEEEGGELQSSPKYKRARIGKKEIRKVVNSPRKPPQRRERRQERSSSRPTPLPARTRPIPARPKEVIPFVSDNVIPPWTTLPYEILQTIFTYASSPLFDDVNAPTASISWLLKASHVHKAFFEPAMAALYRCPPLLSQSKPHQLQALVSSNPDRRTINYNVKIKRLELEYRILAYSAGKEYGSFDLGTLIKHLPQLTEIDVWSIYDTPRIRRSGYSEKAWVYPETLFEALVEAGHKLRAFHWNGKFMGKMVDEPAKLYEWMLNKHLLSPLQSIRSLTLTNFLGDTETRVLLEEPILTPSKPLTTTQADKEATREEKRQTMRKQDEDLAKAICALPELKTLDLQMCSVVDAEWLQLLPTTLTSLGITICDRLTSDGLQAFLTSHGSNLKQLVLNHNSSLSMSFLTTLKETCPHLEAFEMDLTYYSKFASSRSAEPEYENLLLPDEQPTWPKTLRSIDMHHLRQWTSSAAETFFSSLINSAEELPDLRYLGLSVSLNISWRERATIRDQWEDKLKRIFLRKLVPPNPHLMSLRGMREWKARQNARVLSHVEIQTRPKTEHKNGEEAVGVSRRTHRALPTPQASTSESSGKRKLRPRKSTSDNDNDHSDSAARGLNNSLRDMVMQAPDRYIQGMCDVVDIRIDNLRPTETQLHESDFLDSEPSGDEEWDEGTGDLDDEVLFSRRRGKARGRKSGARHRDPFIVEDV